MNKRSFIKNSLLVGAGTFLLPRLNFANLIDRNPSGNFTLPDLNYSYSALSNVIDETTMTIHHSKHHQGYINKLNKALKDKNDRTKNLKEIIRKANISDTIRNNGGGHYNHSLYWDILKPGGSEMSSSFLNSVNDNFGSKESLLNELASKGASQFGSGWVWLSKDSDGKLFVSSTANQDNPIMHHIERKGDPILGIDVWEHAYYLKYQNKRKDYLKQILTIIDWAKF